MTREPLVTVAIPVHDGEATVRRAVQSALCQNYPNIEVLVLDDGSTDGTASVLGDLRHPRLRVLSSAANIGVAAARAKLIDEAHGAWIAWLDADDRMHPQRIEAQVARVSRSPSAVICATWTCTERQVEGGRQRQVQRWCTDSTFLAAMAFYGNPFSTSSVMHSKAIPGVRPRFDQAEDYDMWLQLLKHGDAVMVPRVLVARTFTPQGVGLRHGDRIRDVMRLLRKELLGEVGLSPDDDRVEILSRLGGDRLTGLRPTWKEARTFVEEVLTANARTRILPEGAFAAVSNGRLLLAMARGDVRRGHDSLAVNQVARAGVRAIPWLSRRSAEWISPRGFPWVDAG